MSSSSSGSPGARPSGSSGSGSSGSGFSGSPASGELAALAARVAGWARDGEGVEAYVVRGTDTEIRVYEGEVESLSSATSAGIGVRVVLGNRQGFAYAGSLDESVLGETLAEARDNATFASPDDWVGLAEPDGIAPASLDLWRDSLLAFPTDQKVAQTLELERQVRAADSRIRQVEAADWGDSSFEAAVASSSGVQAAWRRTVCHLSVTAVASDGDDSQTGNGFSVGRAPEELDPSKPVNESVERATRLLGATKPRSAHLTVIFEPRVAATLLAILAGTLNGESVQKGRSLFADRLGESIAVEGLTLVDDPTNPDAFGAAAFDSEGLATRRNVLIDNGVLQMFLYNTYAGRRAGTGSTGSAVRGFKSPPGVGARAIQLLGGTGSAEQIRAEVGEGLLVQTVSGVHSGVNPISGDFSVGAQGLRVRGGELAEPVREITIASTLQRMLQGVVAIGNDVEWLPSSAAGVTLAIGDVAMAGT